jgi:hypothetical protein
MLQNWTEWDAASQLCRTGHPVAGRAAHLSHLAEYLRKIQYRYQRHLYFSQGKQLKERHSAICAVDFALKLAPTMFFINRERSYFYL